MLRAKIYAFLIGSLALTAALPARAEWPERQVTFILPFTAGGGVDGMARLLAEKLRGKFNVPFIIENRPGAGGNIGVQVVASAAPDGYTFVLGTNSTHVTNPLIQALPYNVDKDFAPVAGIFDTPNILFVRSSLNVKTVSHLISLAKSDSQKLFYGSTGPGSSQFFAGDLLNQKIGGHIRNVTYKGASDIMTALLGGHLDLAFNTASSSTAFLSDANVRALGVTSAKRLSIAPDLPTIAESVPGFEVSAWAAIWAPAGTPKPIVEKLATSVLEIQKDKDFLDLAQRLVATPMPLGPEALDTYVKSERSKWSALLKK